MAGTSDDPIVQLHVLIAEVKHLRADMIVWRDSYSAQIKRAIVMNIVADAVLLAISLTALILAAGPG